MRLSVGIDDRSTQGIYQKSCRWRLFAVIKIVYNKRKNFMKKLRKITDSRTVMFLFHLCWSAALYFGKGRLDRCGYCRGAEQESELGGE